MSPPNAFNKTFIVWKPYFELHRNHCILSKDDRTHWVLTQKTVTKWAHVLLNGAHIINDVEENGDDRIVLNVLLAALRKQKVNSRTKEPEDAGGAAGKTNQALKFLIADGVKLVNIVRRTSPTVV